MFYILFCLLDRFDFMIYFVVFIGYKILNGIEIFDVGGVICWLEIIWDKNGIRYI